MSQEANEHFHHDHDEARSLHRVVRAMHDGECPRCHTVHDAEQMREKYRFMWDAGWLGDDQPSIDGWACPNCHFHITQEEADEVFKQFGPFMERNLAVFESWREKRQQAKS